MTDIKQHLEPSELGTRQYWDDAYVREISNHAQHADDQGTIWFEDSGAEDKVIDLLHRLDPNSSSRVIDIGTGNGHMLFAMLDGYQEWQGELIGVDYSAHSVKLAQQICMSRKRLQQSEDEKEARSQPEFYQWDLINDLPGTWLSDGFDIVLDKGTFDAISLSSDRICQSYRSRILPLLKPGAYFIITSCNWTKDELLQWFVHDDGNLTCCDEAKYSTFSFGGKQGQSVCTLVFQRTKDR